MKKLFSLLLILAVCLSSFVFTSCEETTSDPLVLRICNCEDYIYEEETDEGTLNLCDMFERDYEAATGIDITVEYSTYGTNEILYNNLKINPGSYDLVCPSDYMIQKMISEDMLDKFDNVKSDVPNYTEYGSPYLKGIFDENGWTDYALPYMWGTMGFIYNPEFVTEEEASTWNCVLNKKFTNKTTIKDSVRDSYFLGVALAKLDDLTAKNAAFENGTISQTEYASFLADAFNDTSEETVDKVEPLLKQAKTQAFSLEVDSGKDDMVTGKVWMNFAWSGDAVYAMDDAEGLYLEDDADFTPTYLNYSVPKEGSNVWFDGWVMPKGANKTLAIAFLDYISDPENACLNMDYIGYTSPIAGETVYERMLDCFGCTEEPTEDNTYEVDLSYFFGEETVVYADTLSRQFTCQYPPQNIIARCAIMQHFEGEDNDRINNMWNRVKADDLGFYFIVLGVVAGLMVIAFVVLYFYKNGLPQRPMKKGYKRVA